MGEDSLGFVQVREVASVSSGYEPGQRPRMVRPAPPQGAGAPEGRAAAELGDRADDQRVDADQARFVGDRLFRFDLVEIRPLKHQEFLG